MRDNSEGMPVCRDGKHSLIIHQYLGYFLNNDPAFAPVTIHYPVSTHARTQRLESLYKVSKFDVLFAQAQENIRQAK